MERTESFEDGGLGELEKETGGPDRPSQDDITLDKDLARNWSTRKKVYHVGITATYAFTTTFASVVYTPAYPQVMEAFNVPSTVALLGLSIYNLGLACGPVIASPLSETFGRLIVYRITLPTFALFTLGAGCSQNIASFIICRFFAGVFGAPALAVGGGTIADLFPPATRAVAMSIFIFAPFCGPTFGPVVGGFIAERKSWRWTQWVILLFAIATYAYSLFMRETYTKIILRRRAKRLHIHDPTDAPPKTKDFLTATLVRPLIMLATEPIVGFISLYVSFNFGILFCFFAAFPLVYHSVYDFTPSQTGLTFLAIFIGCALAVATHVISDRIFYLKQTQKHGEGTAIPPEHRLYPAMIGSFGLTIGLFWFAWTARPSIHWISPVIAAIPFAWGNLCVFISGVLYTVDVFGALYGASALAANGFLRYAFATAFPLFAIQMYTALSTPWATTLLAFLSILLLPIPWVLFKWGPAIRRRSRYVVPTPYVGSHPRLCSHPCIR